MDGMEGQACIKKAQGIRFAAQWPGRSGREGAGSTGACICLPALWCHACAGKGAGLRLALHSTIGGITAWGSRQAP